MVVSIHHLHNNVMILTATETCKYDDNEEIEEMEQNVQDQKRTIHSKVRVKEKILISKLVSNIDKKKKNYMQWSMCKKNSYKQIGFKCRAHQG